MATAQTLEGIKKAYESALVFHLDGMRADGDEIPAALAGQYELVYELEISALLRYTSGFISMAAIARETGLNQKLLGHYISGFRKPKQAQQDKIRNGIRNLCKEVLAVGVSQHPTGHQAFFIESLEREIISGQIKITGYFKDVFEIQNVPQSSTIVQGGKIFDATFDSSFE